MLARIFLHLAQQADLQAHQLQEDLERFEKGHAELFEPSREKRLAQRKASDGQGSCV